jgi:hypothetical protein
MKKFAFLLLLAMSTVILSVVSLSANEIANEHVSLGTRAESIDVRMAQLETRSKMAVQHKEETKFSNSGDATKKSKVNNKMLAKSIYHTMHPGTYQHPHISYFSNQVELTDGSVWSVSPSYVYMTKNWYPTDLIVITPNQSWFSSYSFCLTNQNTGQSVPVNLELGPVAPSFGAIYTHWIASIDYFLHIIYLEDGSTWDMSAFDRNITEEWMPGDVVIIGVNDGWLSSSKPNVLINVATLTFAAGSVTY